LIAYIVVLVWQSLQLLGIDRNQAILFLALLFQQAISNLSETHWFSVLSIDFVLITLATMALARGLLEVRLRFAFGDPHPPVSGPIAGTALPLPARRSSRRLSPAGRNTP
jgi:hypothetical protein